MKTVKIKIWIILTILVLFVILGQITVQNIRYAGNFDDSMDSVTMLFGEYSIDGGEWKSIKNDEPINECFRKVVFRGKLIDVFDYYNKLFILSKNVWYSLKTEDGIEITSNDPYDYSDIYDGELQPEEKMLNTPGFLVNEVYIDLAKDYIDKDVILEVEYPYRLASESFSECFSAVYTHTEGLYLIFFFKVLPWELIFLLICFFGIFFFPIASGLLGKINFKYLTFGQSRCA